MPARLITISMSHFCEKGRWALDLAGIPYRETGSAPGLHLPSIARYRAATTPVLVLPGGPVLRGSDVILEHAIAHGAGDLMPADPGEAAAVRRWLHRCDDLGWHTRRWFYAHALPRPAAMQAMLAGVPAWQRRALPVALPAVGKLISRRFDLHDGAAAESAEVVREVFAQADAARSGSDYLVGDRFTAADLTFAALAAPVCFPEGYGPPGASTIEDVPADVRPLVEAWRREPSCRAVETVYARHRRPGGP